MNQKQERIRSAIGRFHISPVGVTASLLIVIGLLLGTTVHVGFMALVALGAFGPGLLREWKLIDDFDEFQKTAAATAGYRAYLVTGILLLAVLIARSWGRLAFGGDQVSASLVVTIMLVVYFTSFCLSFWDGSKAAFSILLTFGLFWLAFVGLSHGSEPMSLLMEGLVVPGPFLLGALLSRWWPKVTALLLLAISIHHLFFFHIIPRDVVDPEEMFQKLWLLVLVPLPLMISAIALLGSHRRETIE